MKLFAVGVDHLLTIGSFAGRCGLSPSALRFYDECELLSPVAVDDLTGYRYYDTSQVGAAILVRRLRSAEMPVREVRRFMTAGTDERRRLLEAHARRLDQRAETLRQALEQLRVDLVQPTPEGPGQWCAISAAVLAAGFDQVRFAADRTGRRPELAGILVEAREGSLRLVATDSYRLAIRDLVLDHGGAAMPLRGFVPLDTADELSSVLNNTGNNTDEVTLRQRHDGFLEATVDSRAVTIGGKDERFPDYEQVLLGLPSGRGGLTDRCALSRALKESTGTNGKPGGTDRMARIDFQSGALVVRGETGESSIEVSWDGPELSVAVNPDFLAEALDLMVGSDVVVDVTGPLQPVTLRSADAGTFTVLTMPIRS